jgi:Ca2+/Na+ antiporter
MTDVALSAIAGVVLSLVFSYVPGVSSAFDKLETTQKRLTMALLLAIVASGALFLSCANVISEVACTQAGVIGLVNAYIAALVANQAAYTISPKKR